MDLQLLHKSSFIVAGPSQCGKTTLVLDILKHRDILFDKILGKIHWFSATEFPTELCSKKLLDDITFYDGVPCNLDMIKPYEIIVLDDLLEESKNNTLITSLFTRLVHHIPCVVFAITQNLFQASKEVRTRSLNANYIILFKNPRDRTQVATLARQMCAGNGSYLIQVFKDATKNPHCYLLIDLNQNTSENLRLRTNCIPSKEKPFIITYEPL